MAKDYPVIVSNNLSLPEVINNAGLKVNCYDYKNIAILAKKLFEDKKLHNALAAKGYQQAHKFTWDKAIEKIIYVIDNKSK